MPTAVVFVLLVFFGVVVLVYLFKDKLVLFLDRTLKIVVLICILMVLSSLFFPVIYKNLANFTLENAGILATIKNIDSSIDFNNLTQPGEQFLNDLGNFLTGSNNKLPIQTTTPGKLETELYPSLVDGLGNIYILISLVFSLGGITIVIYLSFTTSAIAKAEVLESKVKKLEDRLLKLEKVNYN